MKTEYRVYGFQKTEKDEEICHTFISSDFRLAKVKMNEWKAKKYEDVSCRSWKLDGTHWYVEREVLDYEPTPAEIKKNLARLRGILDGSVEQDLPYGSQSPYGTPSQTEEENPQEALGAYSEPF